jgi:hypothetical protein
MRRLVAVLGHAPGLWLIHRQLLPRRLLVANIMAVAITIVAMAAAYRISAPPWRLGSTLATWGALHLIWGLYLASEIDRSA